MIKNLLSDDDPAPEAIADQSTASTRHSSSLSLFDDDPQPNKQESYAFAEAEPQSVAETVRQSGLAWSAGIAFFAAVVFMLIVGWGADLLLGTSPWGMVGGIVVGSVIGFVQFFRLTSQIFKK